MFSYRNQRVSQDFYCIASNVQVNGTTGLIGGGAATIRSSRASSFDFNDMISKENNQIDEITGSSLNKVPLCYSTFRRN